MPWELRTHCSIARLAKRREGLGEQHLCRFRHFGTCCWLELSCLTEPEFLLNMPQTQEVREGGCRNTLSKHVSRSDKPQAGQMNFTSDSFGALHRRVLFRANDLSCKQRPKREEHKRDPGEDHLQTRPNTKELAKPLRSWSNDAIGGSWLYQCTIMRNPKIGTSWIFGP